jgi:hypothetical protein
MAKQTSVRLEVLEAKEVKIHLVPWEKLLPNLIRILLLNGLAIQITMALIPITRIHLARNLRMLTVVIPILETRIRTTKTLGVFIQALPTRQGIRTLVMPGLVT